MQDDALRVSRHGATATALSAAVASGRIGVGHGDGSGGGVYFMVIIFSDFVI